MHRQMPVPWGSVLGSTVTLAVSLVSDKSLFPCQRPLTLMARIMALLLLLGLQSVLVKHEGSCSLGARLNHLSCHSLRGVARGPGHASSTCSPGCATFLVPESC